MPSARRRTPRTPCARRRRSPGLSSSPSTYLNGDDPSGAPRKGTSSGPRCCQARQLMAARERTGGNGVRRRGVVGGGCGIWQRWACWLAACGGAATAGAERGRVMTAAEVSCRDGGPGGAPVEGRDVRMGPLTVLFARRTPRDPRDAFDGHGWKVPVTLLADATATLSVPWRLRGRVGLVFTLESQSRVWRRGVRAADPRVSFTSCTGEGAPVRTGWPGGIVVDRPRCATLLLRVAEAAEPIERRVPLDGAAAGHPARSELGYRRWTMAPKISRVGVEKFDERLAAATI